MYFEEFTFILLIFLSFYYGFNKIITIIAIIYLVIFLTNFVSCGDGNGSRVSSVKANAHTIQTMLETYAVDWKGEYPNNIDNLKLEASKNAVNKYWKELKNPYTKLTGKGNAYDDFTQKNLEEEKTLFFNTSHKKLKENCVYYAPTVDKNGKVIKYYIYASGKDGFLIKDKDEKLFVLTNS